MRLIFKIGFFNVGNKRKAAHKIREPNTKQQLNALFFRLISKFGYRISEFI